MDAMTYDRSEISRNALAQAALAEGKRLRRLDDELDAERRWHLVQISQQHFTKASFFLKDAGYTIYAPQSRDFVIPKSNELSLGQRRQRHLFKREKLSPYFGSYRFVRFAAGDPWHDLFKILGVHGLGVANGVPVPMPDALIERLKAKEINGAIPGSTPVRALIFSVGDTAKVNEGAFIGFEGKIERMDENGRIRLLLELFAGLVPVDLTADQVDKVTG
jgi:transcription antitermination factor NusG